MFIGKQLNHPTNKENEAFYGSKGGRRPLSKANIKSNIVLNLLSIVLLNKGIYICRGRAFHRESEYLSQILLNDFHGICEV